MHRIPLVSKLIQMLEMDASWVEIYGISGELHIPQSPASDDALREPIETVQKVWTFELFVERINHRATGTPKP